MALSAQIAISLVAHETSAGDMSRTLRVTPAAYGALLADGTSANQAQVVWSDSRTMAGSTETLNLGGLLDVRDGATATVTITAVKAAYAKNSHASAGISVAGGPFGSGVTLAAGAVAVLVNASAAGMAATGVTVTGSSGATYDIMLIGEGSVS
ncbi:MAG: hypothetical protein ACO38P_02770 [Phycisphaerales bacterium]